MNNKRHFFDLVLVYVKANLKVEVSTYYLNYLWWVFEPLIMMGMFYVVFGIMLHQGAEHFVGFLFVGLVFWNWFARSVNNAKESILGAKGIILQVYVPKVFFPFVTVCQDGVKHLFVTVILLLFLFIYPTPVGLTWIALPLLMFIQWLFILAVSIFVAAIVPFVPDLRFIISTGIELLFFGTGVFYDLDTMVIPEHRFIIYLNPLAGLLKGYRQILLNETWPDWYYLGWVSLFSVIFLCIATYFLKKVDYIYPRLCQQ